ncbi:MAG: hypothetical protein EOP34_10640 [Rickettsiales bacterium]|nr:MAG: hypothetical protein EOP34_10640 [Rickettsiales bacterium]
MYSPDPGGTTDSGDTEPLPEQEITAENEDEATEETPLIDKIKEELQAWSNKDQADQDFDDTRV